MAGAGKFYWYGINMRNWLVISISLLIAFILMLLPMPEWTVSLRPAWVLMVLIYWVMALPDTVNVGVAWLVGLIADLFTGTLFGEHALAYAVVAYLVYRSYTQLRMYPIIQQGMAVLFFVFVYQFILYCIQGFIGALPTSRLYWMSSLTSMFLWPWLYVLLGDWQRRYVQV